MKRNKKLLIGLFLIIFIGLLILIPLSKYFLFSDCTSRFQAYLSQADGMKVVITSDGKEVLRTDLLCNSNKVFSQVISVFRTEKLRPAFRPKLEKLISGKSNMTSSINTGVVVRILLFTQGEQLIFYLFRW